MFSVEITMKKYYAGIGSRSIPDKVYKNMTVIASILERLGYTLRSGHANGADMAFEEGVQDPSNMNIFLPFSNFNGSMQNGTSHIHIGQYCDDYDNAYKSLIYHPNKYNMNQTAKDMMIRNYFQHNGLIDQPISEFVICYTKDAANGTSIPTTRESGGSGQCIRLAALVKTPVYNLKDKRYENLEPQELVDLILENLKNKIHPDIKTEQSTSLF